jgi:hypothetical protein
MDGALSTGEHGRHIIYRPMSSPNFVSLNRKLLSFWSETSTEQLSVSVDVIHVMLVLFQ